MTSLGQLPLDAQTAEPQKQTEAPSVSEHDMLSEWH